MFSSLFATEPEESTTEPTLAIPEPKEEDFYPEAVKQLLAKNEPYSLEYTSNGDGTCYVSKLYLNNRYTTEFDIIIPETSPAGDLVTGIDWGYFPDSFGPLLPKFLTAQQLEAFTAQVDADYSEVGYAGIWWANAYEILDVSKMNDEEREAAIARCPLAEYMVIAEFLPKMSNVGDTLSRVVMANLTPYVTKQCYEDVIQEARAAGAPEEMLAPYQKLIEELPTYANYSKYVRFLHIPSSVSSINAESLVGVMLKLTFESKRHLRGVVLPVFDAEITAKICDYIRSYMGNVTLFIFSQSTTAKGYEDIDDFAVYSPDAPIEGVRSWHYVDGVPTVWGLKYYY